MTKQSGIPAGVDPCKSAALDPDSKCTGTGVSQPALSTVLQQSRAATRITLGARQAVRTNKMNFSLRGQTVPCRRADDAVRDKSLLPLELLDGQFGRGAEIAVY